MSLIPNLSAFFAMDPSDAAALVAEYESLYVEFTVSKTYSINLTRLSSVLSNYCAISATSMLSNLSLLLIPF